MSKYYYIFAALLLGLMIFLGFNRHSRDTFDNYHSVLWSDAAGYHAYLPFLLDDDFSSMVLKDEEALVLKTGQGFQLHDGEFFTKYPFGVAMLQLPFYLIADAISQYDEPFNEMDYHLVLLAGLIYGFVGLLLYFSLLLRFEISPLRAAFWSVVSLFGTNLFYYIIDSPGYSHVYSYFTFGLLCHAFLNWYFRKDLMHGIQFGFSLALVMVIRPFNLVLALPLLLVLRQLITENIKDATILRLKQLLVILIPILLLGLTQIGLWSLMSDSFMIDSYKNEGFTHLLSPRIAEVLFSTKNGMLAYTPWWLAVLIPIISWSRRRVKAIGLLLFALPVYLYGSWWNWELGCSFGYRGMVEMIGVFTVLLVLASNGWSRFARGCLVSVGIFCIVWNLKLTYSYDECWLGGDWDYGLFFTDLVFGPTR